ncbi:hypothetical protein E2R51_07600 [Jeotgalibacillus sp. S-D1]|nr:hypothetical protein E2R51_07600 [Jeotgalibacillus sp. S-D1]
MIGAEGVRLLRDVAGEVRPLKREALKRAHPRPAESERLRAAINGHVQQSDINDRSKLIW